MSGLKLVARAVVVVAVCLVVIGITLFAPCIFEDPVVGVWVGDYTPTDESIRLIMYPDGDCTFKITRYGNTDTTYVSWSNNEGVYKFGDEIYAMLSPDSQELIFDGVMKGVVLHRYK